MTKKIGLKFVLIFFLIVSIFCVYTQLMQYGFVYDDFEYVVNNGDIKKGFSYESIKGAFCSIKLFNWHPLTWLSHTLDYSLYGNNAKFHHLTNLIFHILNSILFFLLLLKLSDGQVLRSAFATFLFALHPLHTESIAWISERKDVLSTFFGFFSIYFYIIYIKSKRFKHYLVSFLLFSFSLMSKAMFVTMPFLLLLFDFWMNRFSKKSYKKLVIEKLPFLLFSISISIITFIAQMKSGAVRDIATYTIPMRFANASISYIKYLYKMFYPVDLAIPYTYPISISHVSAFLCFILIVFLTYLFLHFKKKHLIFGWFWYIVTLLPVIGIVQVGSQPMADRYSYVPLCGIFVLLSWLFYDIVKGKKKIFILLTFFIVTTVGVISYFQAKYWQNPITLFKHTIDVTERGSKYRINSDAHNNLSVAYFDRGEFQKSIEHSLNILKEKPNNMFSLNNIGIAYTRLGKFNNALYYFKKALKINYNDANVHNSLGGMFFNAKQYEASLKHLKKAFEIEPGNAGFCNNIGGLYANLGQFKEATKYFKQSLNIDPNNQAAKGNYLKALEYLKKSK